VKQGAIVDASVTPTLRKPKGKSSYTLAERQEPPLDKTLQAGVDQEARWAKKGGQLHYGYKRHYLSDAQAGLVLAVHTTPANVHPIPFKISFPALFAIVQICCRSLLLTPIGK
jgi:IS5 family transposase